MKKQLIEFIDRHNSVEKPLVTEAKLAYWNASISGKDEDYAKAETLQQECIKIVTNKSDFEILKKIKASGEINESLLIRQLDILYNQYLLSKANPEKLKEIVSLEVQVEKKYSNFRSDINGKRYTDNEIEYILNNSINDNELKQAWFSHKKIGNLVADDIQLLVKKRNEIAVDLGFQNYHEMNLTLGEQNPDDIEKIFDELDILTKQAYIKLKNDIDLYLSDRLKINKNELMPWHYQNRFFQEAPKIYKLDLDDYYKNKNLEEITKNYYAGLGLKVDELIAQSDLYEKPGKNQHAYCISIDTEGDIRVLCNIKNNSQWMNTMLHEFGHAVYDKYIDRSLPYLLRNPSHTFTTEAIAMMFGRLGSNPQWLKDATGISGSEKDKIRDACFKTLRLEQLVFSRWVQVIYRFEKSMYENTETDLNSLWWSLVEKYQLIKQPVDRDEPDWASKIHIATSPCYYHNYLLGELLASQLHYYITMNIIKSQDYTGQSYYNNPDVGNYLIEKVFKPGASLSWNELIENATGEKLTSAYYARQFVE